MGAVAYRTEEVSMARERYNPPARIETATLNGVLATIGRPTLEPKQMSFIASSDEAQDTELYYAGDLSLLRAPAVAVVGARAVSDEGAARARRISRELANAGVIIVSGLAKGVDRNAHEAAIATGGHTCAVIGTPLEKAYPAEHGALQTVIAREHLLISPFAAGSRVFQSNFPRRNKVMAALTDGSVIVEASDTSGTLHQVAECQRLGRWLFILRSVFDDQALSWPRSFASYEKMKVVDTPADVLDRVLR